MPLLNNQTKKGGFMASMKCSACGEMTESREMNACGAAVCPGCGAGNHGLCSFCYSDLNYMS